ncbi:MAG: hypothetical protein QOD71_2961 [Thermoleophilaceae bacterium]|jgi:hypothetical protein|nr:hypothetical protein [Thermoleophilaceae bacterium]
MKQIAGFPYFELEFDKQAEPVDQTDFEALLAELGSGEAAEVLVLVHGWNNDMDEARRWYDELAGHLRTVLDKRPPTGADDRSFVIFGVLWPSKKFADRALIPGGAAAVGGAVADEELEGRIDTVRDAFDAPDAEQRLQQAKALVGRLEDSPKARDEFVDLIRGVLPKAAGDDGDDFAGQFWEDPGREVLEALEAPVLASAPGGDGGGATSIDSEGSAAGLSLSLGGIKAAAERFLNLTTYYQMKERAGLVGTRGLNPRLRALRTNREETRIHLVGHSFGGRLVTAATVGMPGDEPVRPDTLTLLQAAFSHYGFASNYEGEKDGFFRRMVTDGMVRGPVLITHSVHDTAVGYAYPLASRLARQVAAGLGDAGDRFGGIGRNGAQKTPEAIKGRLQQAGEDYGFRSPSMVNLNADAVISGHGDIRSEPVAFAVLSAVAAAGHDGG